MLKAHPLDFGQEKVSLIEWYRKRGYTPMAPDTGYMRKDL
jgi:hypothetical protein